MVLGEREIRTRLPMAGEAAMPDTGNGIPKLSGDIRHLIPKLGLRNYWYPAILARRVGKKRPVQVKMLGEELCLFRGEKGDVVCLSDICPHRGARLGEGDCHWAGTVACPYHGWVWDEHGKNVAVLAEGPDSTVCGKPGTEARVYPTRTLKGVVFVWIGEDEPAPIEEDVPEEFFDPAAVIVANDRIVWDTNWEVGLENSMDSHVGYLHRDAVSALLSTPNTAPSGASGSKILFTGNGFRSGPGSGGPRAQAEQPDYHVYPQGWRWPKHNRRRMWAWAFGWFFDRTHVPAPSPKTIRWSGGHRLPGMFRAGPPAPIPQAGTNGKNAPRRPRRGLGVELYGYYTRVVVPIEEWKTRVWYYHYIRPESKMQEFWYKFWYWTLYRWISEYNFSQQDMRVMVHQKFDWPEKLSGTDAEVIQWRKLVVTKHFGGRNAPFELRATEGLSQGEAPDADMFPEAFSPG